jgi:hypothetical protein
MKYTFRFSLLLASLAVAATGCHMPANSPYEKLASHRPLYNPHTNVLPPSQMLMHPGPGVDGPGPGVMMTGNPVSGLGAGGCGPGAIPGRVPTSQISFIGMDGMQVNWDVTQPGSFDSEAHVFPSAYNFPQGAIYRLKLSNIPSERHRGKELYPTIEIAPTTPKTEAFLAHNSIPFQLTGEDFDHVASGNFVTKVIYLPDAEHQELAVAGVETLVSTRLDPGVDPIVEADRKGSILMIVRLGNKDLQAAGGSGAGTVTPAGYNAAACGGDGCYPGNGAAAYLAGVTAPSYGMPITGTPIGLPGPPHLPLGHQAGLQSHTIKNHTHMHIPGPVEHFKVDVKQKPGLSYPEPVSHVRIVEKSKANQVFTQPCDNKTYYQGGGGGASCYSSDCEQ